jgi:heme iron utilization protein
MTENPNVDVDVKEELNGLWERRVAVLATSSAQGPAPSHAPYLRGEDWRTVYVHLSQLAQHTKNLVQDARVGFFLVEPDSPDRNPLALRRLTLQGNAVRLARDAAAYPELKARYLERFKQSKMMFDLPDFHLWELRMDSALFVGGFGRAFRAEAGAPEQWQHVKR